MITKEQVISIGTLAKPFGTQGAILCRTTNNRWQGGDFIVLSIDNILVPFRVNDYHDHGQDLVFELKDIDTEAKARTLTGREAFMLRADITEEEDEMLWTDFVGYTVIDTDQGELGTITDMDDSTENILATLSLNSKLAQRASTLNSMIPLHEDFIQSIDENQRVLTITLPYQL